MFGVRVVSQTVLVKIWYLGINGAKEIKIHTAHLRQNTKENACNMFKNNYYSFMVPDCSKN